MNPVFNKINTPKNKETAAGFMQIIFVLVVVGGMLAITAALNFNADGGPALSSAPEQLVVDVVLPLTTQHAPSETFSGAIEARANVTITPEVGGRVTNVHPHLLPGGTINAGETLFSLDKADYQIALERASAEAAAASADLAQTKANAGNFIKDWQKVYPEKPAPALVAKEPQIAAIEARLSAANANIRQARINLERTDIIARNTIRIVESNIEEGLLVVTGGQYGTYYVPQSLRIRANAEPRTINKLGLSVGKPVSVSVSGIDTATIEGNIISIGAALDTQTRLQPVIISLPNDIKHAPGTFVSITARGNTAKSVFRLPATALSTRNTMRRVKDGKLDTVTIEVVDLTDNSVVVRAFDVEDGIVVSQVPTSFVKRPVQIRKTVELKDTAS